MQRYWPDDQATQTRCRTLVTNMIVVWMTGVHGPGYRA